MTPPTDTIPEAREAAVNLFGMIPCSIHDVEAEVTKACLSYHSRRLAECGDAREVAHAIQDGFKGAFSRGAIMGSNAIMDLINQHTAKAVEEATKQYLKASPAIAERDYQIATLQNQYELLEQRFLEQYTPDAVKDEKIRLLTKQCEELKERLLSAIQDRSSALMRIKELSTLQQDVKPVLEYLEDFADCQDGAPDASPKDKEACRAALVLQTFLSKHPELGEKP